tara:strand:- start:8643 stop:9518 length:876 start_codon:yes stop_codon:yes gene_type:complete
MSKYGWLILMLSLSSGASATNWQDDIAYLSSPALAGRETGSAPSKLAQQYIVQRLTELGYRTERAGFSFTSGFFANTQGINIFTSECQTRCLVISAHYDHLGRHGQRYYPGANDNASGVAALLYLAQQLQAMKEQIIFVAFDGEEQGLHGAKHFVETQPAQRLYTNLNLDMLNLTNARSRLFVYAPHKMCAAAKQSLINSPVKLSVVRSGRSINRRLGKNITDWRRASDHYAFLRRGIAAIFITAAEDKHYHSPEDTFEHINKARYQATLPMLTQFSRALLTRQCQAVAHP